MVLCFGNVIPIFSLFQLWKQSFKHKSFNCMQYWWALKDIYNSKAFIWNMLLYSVVLCMENMTFGVLTQCKYQITKDICLSVILHKHARAVLFALDASITLMINWMQGNPVQTQRQVLCCVMLFQRETIIANWRTLQVKQYILNQ